MKNFFLYAARDCAEFRQLEEALRQLSVQARLITLPPGSTFTSPLCLELRSNDLIILFAANEQDIAELLLLRDEYDSFRILLVLPHEQQLSGRAYRLLTPRMMFYLDTGLIGLGDYLHKVLNTSSDPTQGE